MKTNCYRFVAIAFIVALFGCKKELYRPVNPLAQALRNPDSLWVVTPFGYRLKADVHTIEPGFKLQYQANHLVKIDRSGKVAEDFGVQAPLKYLQKNNINGINRNHLTTSIKQTIPDSLNKNWDIWARGTGFQTGGSLDNFKTSWVVPHTPTNSTGNQTLFIFNGLEDTSQHFLLQPVLQWGLSAAGGGKYWGVSNWLVGCPGCPAFNTTVSTVSVNDVLTGTMTKSGPDGSGNYTYTSSFGSALSASDLPISAQTQSILLNNFTEALEAYGITGYNDYPPDLLVKMYSIRVDGVYKVTDFTGYNQNTSYGQHVVLPTDPGEVDLYFHYGNTQTIKSYTKNNCGSGGTGSTVADTVLANTFLAASQTAANTAATNYLDGGAGQSNANAKGFCTYPVAFDISSNNSITDFSLWVNGNNVSGPRGVSQSNPIVINGYTNSPGTSTVVMEVSFGYMPTNATLYGNFAPINGVISGSNITFSSAALVSAGTVWIVIN